jgi:benzodiazapine receptor
MQTTRKPTKLKWWQVALISIAVSAIGGLSSLMSAKKEQKLYNKKLKQAPWAPPAALFAPAWTINNYFIIKALVRIIEKDMPERRKLLLMQAGIWVIFFSFNYVYFRRKSPVLAAVWTISDNVLAMASLLLSARSDKKTALNYLPLALWTTYAATLAGYQALTNADPVTGTKPLL